MFCLGGNVQYESGGKRLRFIFIRHIMSYCRNLGIFIVMRYQRFNLQVTTQIIRKLFLYNLW